MIRKLVIEVEILEEVEYIDNPEDSYTSHTIKSVKVDGREVSAQETYVCGESSVYAVFDPDPENGGWRIDLIECEG